MYGGVVMNRRMMGNYANTNFHALQKTHDNLSRVAAKADLDKVFLMDWKGTTFNVVPFLCAGISFYALDEDQRHIAVSVLHHFVKNSDCLCEDLKSGLRKVFQENLSQREFELFNCLPKHPNPAKASLSIMLYYLYIRDRRNFLSVMLEINSMLLAELAYGERTFDYWKDMPYKDFGNKEAFSFYIGLAWLLKTEPKFKMYMGKFLSHLNLKEKYREFCPENSFLDKVLKGELEDDKIGETYTSIHYLDGSSDYMRDVLLASSDGEYDGHDLTKEIRDLIDYFDFEERDYLYGESQLSFFMSCFAVRGIADDKEKYEQNLERHQMEIEKNMKSIHKKDSLLDEYRDKIDKIEAENKQLRNELKDIHTDEELQKEIDLLNAEIKLLKEENTLFEHTHQRDKQEISLLRKKVGKIEASEIKDKLDIFESDEELESDFEVSLEQKIDLLKDKKIILLGAEFLTPTIQRMEELGFTDVTLCSKDTKKPGKFDICVVLSTRCMHDVVRRMETFAEKYNALWLYSASVNAEKIIELIYEYSIEEEQIDV